MGEYSQVPIEVQEAAARQMAIKNAQREGHDVSGAIARGVIQGATSEVTRRIIARHTLDNTPATQIAGNPTGLETGGQIPGVGGEVVNPVSGVGTGVEVFNVQTASITPGIEVAGIAPQVAGIGVESAVVEPAVAGIAPAAAVEAGLTAAVVAPVAPL